MRPIQPRNFYSDDLTAPITGEPTPPASSALLAEADSWPVAVAVTPYVGTAHIFDGLSASGLFDRYLAAVIAPGAIHARAALSRGWATIVNSTGATNYHEMWSSDGGTTGNDVIHTPWHLMQSLSYLPEFEFQYGAADIADSGDGIVDSPTNNLDRQLELQTGSSPYVEPLFVTQAAGFSLVVTDRVADLENL